MKIETKNILLKIERDFEETHKITKIINSVTINYDLPKSINYHEKFNF